MKERLQKIIAAAGLASRRGAEELIRLGKVNVNGRIITEMGFLADPDKDRIYVQGQRLQQAERLRTIMLYKPRGILTTMSDPEQRKTVADLIEDEQVRLFPIGRLDRQSEGLLLLTNDGELANLLTHPKHGVSKVYQVELSREADPLDLKKLEEGIMLDDGPTLPTKCEPLPLKFGFWYKMVISEGRNRQIRRMFEALGYFVVRLRRVQVGTLRIGDLKPGEKRPLTKMEIDKLRQFALKGGNTATEQPRRGTSNGQKDSSRGSRSSGNASSIPSSTTRSGSDSVRTRRTPR